MNIKGMIQALGEMSGEMIDATMTRKRDAYQSARKFHADGYNEAGEMWDMVEAVLDGLLYDFREIVRRAAEKAGQQ